MVNFERIYVYFLSAKAAFLVWQAMGWGPKVHPDIFLKFLETKFEKKSRIFFLNFSWNFREGHSLVVTSLNVTLNIWVNVAKNLPFILEHTTGQLTWRSNFPHVSNFDWTDRLAGCEERWGPGGREVDGRRVILWDPSMVLIHTQQEARGRWKSILI
jgi:hypothetical protein